MLPQPGDIFARRYRVLREVGRGAMGVVYEAEHATLDRRVAIKVLRRAEPDDGKAVLRFEREAKIAARLESAHVVKVRDVDRTEDGTSYLVMELLDGRDLAAELEARERIPIGEATSWMRDVCAAMQGAHSAGVIHRDLKLSNVFLTKDGQIKVLDFGVAALHGSDKERSATASVAGTPRYMAPEQLLGEAPHPASDVWAIGVMLYRILGGRFPYDGPTMAAQMLAIMDGCPPLGAIAKDVPPELARAVDRALGRTLEERWGSVADLAKALAPYTGNTIDQAEAPKLDRPRRRPIPPPIALVLLGVAGAATAIAVVATRRPPQSSVSDTPSAAREPAPSVAPPPSLPSLSTIPPQATLSAPPPSARAIPPPPASARKPAPVDAAPAASDDGFPTHL